MDYILTWSNGVGRVSSGEYLFDLSDKPEPGFEFDALYYESPTNVAFKILDDAQTVLTEEEIALCQAYCDSFLETGDYVCQAYEEESGLFRGMMLKSIAKEKGYATRLGTMPEYPVCKLVDGEWVRIVCTIKSNGSYSLMPGSVCDACVLFLTLEEWEAFAKPSRTTEIWSFSEEAWVDKRTLDTAKHEADVWLRNAYTIDRTKAMGPGLSLELATWTWQTREAEAWTADNTAETPFLSAMLTAANENLVAAGAEEKTMAELVESVLTYSGAEWLGVAGAIHGDMYGYIYRVRAAESLSELDAVTDACAAAKDIIGPTAALEFYISEDGLVGSRQVKPVVSAE